MSQAPFSAGSPFGEPTADQTTLSPPTAAPGPPPAPTSAFPAAAPSTPSSRGRRRLPAVLAGIVAAVVVAGVGFAGGYEVGQGAAPSPSLGRGIGAAGNGFSFPGASGAPGARGRGFGGGAGGAGTAGTISTVAPDQITISEIGGGSKLVLVDSSTTVTKLASTDEALTDLTQGERVTVVGTTNPDGSVTATQIVVGDVTGLFGGGPRRSSGASAAPKAVP